MPLRFKFTACLFFNRDFYLNYQPSLLLSKKELSSTEYRKYSLDIEHIPDSGYGYCFKVYTENLTWYPLQTNNKLACTIYENLICHVGSATYSIWDRQIKDTTVISKTVATVQNFMMKAVYLIGSRFQKFIGETSWSLLNANPILKRAKAFYHRKHNILLLKDVDAYLNHWHSDKLNDFSE